MAPQPAQVFRFIIEVQFIGSRQTVVGDVPVLQHGPIGVVVDEKLARCRIRGGQVRKGGCPIDAQAGCSPVGVEVIVHVLLVEGILNVEAFKNLVVRRALNVIPVEVLDLRMPAGLPVIGNKVGRQGNGCVPQDTLIRPNRHVDHIAGLFAVISRTIVYQCGGVDSSEIPHLEFRREGARGVPDPGIPWNGVFRRRVSGCFRRIQKGCHSVLRDGPVNR